MRNFIRPILVASPLVLAIPAFAASIQYDDTITNANGQSVTAPQNVSASKPLPTTTVCTSGCNGANASVGANGAAIPGSSTLIGTKDGSGNIQPASSANPVPVSAASLPLPSGAATSANQPTAAAQGSATSGQTGPLVQGAVTTSAPTYTNGQTSPLSLTTNGAARVLDNNSAALLAAAQAGTGTTGSAVPASAIFGGMNVGGNLTGLTGTANGLKVDGSAVTQPVSGADPCFGSAKLGAPINLTASGQVIAGTAAKKTYICSIDLVSATAQNIALVEGTGSTCATNIFGLAGGTTAATGWNLAANGGLTKGSGSGSVYSPSADSNGTAANVCLLLSSTGQTSGQIEYVQQ